MGGPGGPWQEAATCAHADPDIFFPEEGTPADAALAICAECPVRSACLQHALERREDVGVWGGKTAEERQRHALRLWQQLRESRQRSQPGS